ncbi:MAG: helix-turn-helix domain-containing protein [Clostridiales bacterium]|nr:helix-turn-helix domain-containing protein [Clostridiales bacterium]
MDPVFYEKRTEDIFIGGICEGPFPSHVHDVAEIVCITEGYLYMTIAGKQLTVAPGDIAMAFPATPHSYDYISKDAKGLALIFSPDTISEFTHKFRTMTVQSPLLRGEDKPQEMVHIIRYLLENSQQADSPLRLGYLHLFLSYLFSCIQLQPLEKHMQTGLSYQVLHYISEHFTEPLSLETTARALGISRIHLSHIFSQQLKINFRQYINTLRIDRACALLRDPSYTISQIVYLCGYGNPRTFHRAFLAQCGMPPKQYRARFAYQNDEDMPDEPDDGEEDLDLEEMDATEEEE